MENQPETEEWDVDLSPAELAAMIVLGIREASVQCTEWGDRLRMNVDHAQQLVKDGRTAFLLRREDMEDILTQVGPYVRDDSVAVADVSQPGIIALVEHGGQTYGFLIDGSHRLSRAYRQGLEFRVRMLTVEETKSCLW